MDYVLNFKDLGQESVPLAGGKNASLGEMIKAGIRVPPGFALTTHGYVSFISETGIQERILHSLSSVDPDDLDCVDRSSAEVQETIRSAALSSAVQEAIRAAYRQLSKECAVENVPVAVRSSATAEDLPTASFAGQQDTYLWVQGAENVIRNVQQCWASLFTPRAIVYRIKNGFAHEKVLISVGFQKMVNSRTAGVMFTLNPTDGDPSKVVIEGSWGLGETVVSGSVNPDKFVVDKVVMEITERTLSRKHVECVYDMDKGEVVHADVDSERLHSSCLEDKEVRELTEVAKMIEAHYGSPQDIEWAIDRDPPFPESITILQSRPETVWSQRRRKSIIGKKSGYELLMERAMKRTKIRD